MVTVFGADDINEKKFTQSSSRLKILGLIFNTVAHTVSIPEDKLTKSKSAVAQAYHARWFSRLHYRSVLGRLCHVASCVRAARPFMQCLHERETRLNRFHRVSVSEDMRRNLLWWNILHQPQLNGVPMDYFNTLPIVDVEVAMDASDSGLCALDMTNKRYLLHEFNSHELTLIAATKTGERNGFDINFRELLSCAVAVRCCPAEWYT